MPLLAVVLQSIPEGFVIFNLAMSLVEERVKFGGM